MTIPEDPVVGRDAILFIGDFVEEGTFSFRLLLLWQEFSVSNFARYGCTSSRRELGKLTPGSAVNAERDCVTVMWDLAREGVGAGSRNTGRVFILVSIVCGTVRRFRLLATAVGVGPCRGKRPLAAVQAFICPFRFGGHAREANALCDREFRFSCVVDREGLEDAFGCQFTLHVTCGPDLFSCFRAFVWRAVCRGFTLAECVY